MKKSRSIIGSSAAALVLFFSLSVHGQWAVTSASFNTSGAVGSGSGTHTGTGTSTWAINSLSFSSATHSDGLEAGMSFDGEAHASAGNTAGTALASAGASTLAWGEWDWYGAGSPDTLRARLIISISGSGEVDGEQNGTSGTSTAYAWSGASVSWDFTAQSSTPSDSGGLGGWASGSNGASGSADVNLNDTDYFTFGDFSSGYDHLGTSSQYEITGPGPAGPGSAEFTISFDQEYDSEYGSSQYWTQLHLSFDAAAGCTITGSAAQGADSEAFLIASGSMVLNFPDL